MVVGGPAYGESSKVINFSPANATCIMHMQEKKKRKINKPENNGGGFFLTLMHPRGCVCVVHCRAPPSLNEDHGGVGHVLGGGRALFVPCWMRKRKSFLSSPYSKTANHIYFRQTDGTIIPLIYSTRTYFLCDL